VANPPAHTWQVEGQVEAIDADASGRAVQGVRIQFVTSHGVHASVFVPQARYSADYVRGLIESKAREIDAVHNLKG
jgi:hypothetical protein